MPNIELHGYGDDAPAMRASVVAAVSEADQPQEIVVSIFPTDVRDLSGKRSPYLRLVAQPDDFAEIRRLLAPLKQDVEVAALAAWWPKEVISE